MSIFEKINEAVRNIDNLKKNEKMTPQIVREYLLYLEDLKDNEEIAHSEEDDLYFWILKSISLETCENIKECCRIAITSKKINFPRWTA
jgi:hypothetical protein